MNKTVISVIALSMLSACAAEPSAPVQSPASKRPAARPPGRVPAIAPPQPIRPQTGVDRVVGKDARALIALFGQPVQDVRETGARKLQFGGSGCILDAYLYPPAKGREPIVKYVDARLPDGRDTDRAACIMTLSRGR
jgi:hypothetical protein